MIDRIEWDNKSFQDLIIKIPFVSFLILFYIYPKQWLAYFGEGNQYGKIKKCPDKSHAGELWERGCVQKDYILKSSITREKNGPNCCSSLAEKLFLDKNNRISFRVNWMRDKTFQGRCSLVISFSLCFSMDSEKISRDLFKKTFLFIWLYILLINNSLIIRDKFVYCESKN